MSSDKIIMQRTELGRYGTCPHQAYLCRKNEYSLNNRLPVGGIVIHDLVHQAFEACPEFDDDGLLIGYDLEAVAEWFVKQLPHMRPDLQPDALKAAKYIAAEIADIHSPILGVERQIEYHLSDDVVLTTAFDLLLEGKNNSVHVWDWKTGFKKRTKEEAQNDFQSCMFAYLLFKNYDGVSTTANGQVLPKIDTVHIWYHECRWGTKAYARFDRDEEDAHLSHLTTEQALEARIIQAVKMWLTDNQEAWPEAEKCAWCDAIRDCKFADANSQRVADNPQQFVDKFVVIEQLYKAMKQDLAAYFKKHGPVRGTKMVFDWPIPQPKFMPKLCPATKEKTSDDPEIDKHFS